MRAGDERQTGLTLQHVELNTELTLQHVEQSPDQTQTLIEVKNLLTSKRHHMVHLGPYAYPFAQLVVMVTGHMGHHGLAGFQF